MQQAPILLIEDNAENAKTITDILKQNDYSVWVNATLNEALQLLQERKFAIVLTEICVSSGESRRLVRKIKAADPHISIVVITPYNAIPEAIGMMEEGAFGYVTKPFNSSETRIVLEHAKEQYYLKHEARQKSYYHQLSLVDGLTGLYNHRYLYDVLGKKMNEIRKHPQHLSVLMLDIDNFKKYNDSYGHPAGDNLLKELANLINLSIRAADMSFRYGGEEFCVLLMQTQKQSAVLIAERLLNLSRLHLPTTISIGIAAYPEDGDDTNHLIAKADQALYEAKTTGKNKICVI